MTVIRRKDRDCWMVHIKYKHPDGTVEHVRRKSPVNTRRGAERYERDVRQALLDGTYGKREEEAKEKEIPTLEEYSDEFMDTYVRINNKPSEIESKAGHLRRYLNPALGKRKLDQIGIRQIERLKADLLLKGLSPKTVNNALAVLGKMLRYAEETEILTKAPRLKLLRVPKPKFDFLDFDEAEKLLKTSSSDSEWFDMIFMALKTGARYGELCELRWYDVDLRNGRLIIQRSFWRDHVTSPKSGRDREIPLSPRTIEFLRRRRHLKSELILCKSDGGRHHHRSADDALKRICRRAMLRPIGWHALRHTFASHLVMRGVPLKSVQELLGHSTMEMTMRYAHLSPEVKRDAVAVLDLPAPSEDHHRITNTPKGVGSN